MVHFTLKCLLIGLAGDSLGARLSSGDGVAYVHLLSSTEREALNPRREGYLVEIQKSHVISF